MRFRSTLTTASLLFFVLTDIVFPQNTANNEILVYPPKKPLTTRKWYVPLEFGEGRFTTGLYSGLNRFSRRRVNADVLDPFAHRPLPTKKKESSSFKPGTWNWRPGKKLPPFSYKYRIFNLTKDLQGSYEGMPGDYRQNYRPIPHVRFGGTFAPIPPLMGDPTQHRRGWYIKKYRDTLPKKHQYNQYIMDNVNDKIEESYPSLEWVTYSWKNPYKQKYNLSEEKIRPRFGSYEAFSNYDSRFPAYKPKRRYEVIKIPEAPPIYKRIPDWIQKAEHDAFNTKNISSEEKASDPFGKKVFLHPIWKSFTLLPRRKNYFSKFKQHHIQEPKKAVHDAFNTKLGTKSFEDVSQSLKKKEMKKKKASYVTWQHRTFEPRHTHFETQNPRPPRKDGQMWNAYNEPYKRKKNIQSSHSRPTHRWKPWFVVNNPSEPYLRRIPVTFRNYQSPVKFPDEPEVSESVTTKHKTYPPDFYIMPNSSEYDYSVPGGWVDSEFERKRFRGYRPPGVNFDSYYQDYYSEYADWYMKRRPNTSEEYYKIMDDEYFKEHGYNVTRRPHRRFLRSTKTPRPIVKMALKDFAKKMDKKFDEYLHKQFKNFPNTTNKNIFRDISAYLKAVKEDSLEMQTVGNIPFRLFHPPESFFHTSTREAIDTSSMERVLIHGLPAHPSEEMEMRRRRRKRMRTAVRNRMKMTKYKQQIKEMKDKIESLRNKSQETDLLKELKADHSFVREMRLKFMKKSQSKNVMTRMKDGFLKLGSMFGELFRGKKPTNSNETKIITHKMKH